MKPRSLPRDEGCLHPPHMWLCIDSEKPPVLYLQLLRTLMDLAVESGLTVMRGWAHSVDANTNLQTAPGVYNEAVFRGLDYALDEASKRGLKVS